MNISAYVVFVSLISIMVRPAQAGGEFQNVLAFSLIAFHSSITLSYFECPNTHQFSGLASKTLPYKRVVVVAGSSLQTFLLVGFPNPTPILLSVLHKNRHFEIHI